MRRNQASRLEDLPNIGKSIAADLRSIGIETPDQLAHTEPLTLFRKLAKVMGHRHDPCVFYTLLAAQNFLHGAPVQPWWKYTEVGKRQLARSNKSVTPSR